MGRLLDMYPSNNLARNLLLQHDAYTENHVSCKTSPPTDVAIYSSEVLNL